MARFSRFDKDNKKQNRHKYLSKDDKPKRIREASEKRSTRIDIRSVDDFLDNEEYDYEEYDYR